MNLIGSEKKMILTEKRMILTEKNKLEPCEYYNYLLNSHKTSLDIYDKVKLGEYHTTKNYHLVLEEVISRTVTRIETLNTVMSILGHSFEEVDGKITLVSNGKRN